MCFRCTFIFSPIQFLENCQNDRCSRNGILKRGNFLESTNGKYRLYLREAGHLDLTCGETTTWNTTIKRNIDFLYFDKYGINLFLHGKNGENVIIYGKNGSSIRKTKVETIRRAKTLMLHGDGNLVLSDDCNERIWETKTSQDFKCLKGLNELVYIRNYVSIFVTIDSKECSYLFMKSDFSFHVT